MKYLIVLVFIFKPIDIWSQNLQTHYDLGEDRKHFTATLEMFKPDTLGSTFWFVDFDFNLPGKPRSMSGAYWEIAREFYIPGLRKHPVFDELTFHLEYNDGFTAYEIAKDTLGAASYNSIFLTGFAHPVHLGSFVLTTQWLCRIARGTRSADFQFTLVWYQPLFNEKVIFTGFSDIWSQDSYVHPDKKEWVFQTEPQLWYLFTPKLAFGSELEISKNFPAAPNDWAFSPTIALRWEF